MGESVKTYCREHELRETTFYYYQRKLTTDKRKPNKNSFLKFNFPLSNGNYNGYEIIRNGTTIRLPKDFSLDQLKMLKEILN